MNREDIIDILTAVQVVDHRTVGEGDITMWGAIIGHLPKDPCLDAVIYHRREKPGVWLEPGHIVARVRAVLRDRYERQSLAEIEAHNDRIDAKLAGRILELAEAKAIPDQELKFKRPTPNPRLVVCPYQPCRAGIGRACIRPDRIGSKGSFAPLSVKPRYHPGRIDAAKQEDNRAPAS